MKKILSIVFGILLLLSLVACQSEEAAPTTAAVPETIAVAEATEAPATEPTTEPTTAPTEPPKPWAENVLMSHPNPFPDPLYLFGNQNYKRTQVDSVTFLDTLADMPEDAWDVSEAQNGSVMAWMTLNAGKYDLYIAGEGGVMAPADCGYLFGNFENVTAIHFNGNFHTENAESMSWMFGYCLSLEELDVSTFDLSNVTDMSQFLDCCRKLKSFECGDWDTSRVVDMTGFFNDCRKLETLDLTGWDVSNVVTMEAMFSNCKAMTEVDLSGWNTSNVMDMNGMFSWCGNLQKADVSGWDTSNVTDMCRMFAGCPLTEIDVSHFNTANVTDMAEMFVGAKVTGFDLSGWDTSKVTDMSHMLDDIFNLTDLNLGTWEVDSVEAYKNFAEDKVQVDGKPWKELFANAGTNAYKGPEVAASNVIVEPGIPEEGYELTVYRNLPLGVAARKAVTKYNEPGLPEVESFLVDDIPILLCAGEESDSMPITIYLHGGGGSKEDNLISARYTAQETGGYAVSIDGGAYGDSPRGAMSDGETICMWVNDIDKVIAFCSTLPGADLGRISIQGASMGGCGVLTYLARGSFTPIYASASVARADYTVTPTSAPVFSAHGENERDIPKMTNAQIKNLMAQYSPLQHAENMMETYLCVVVGLQDDADAVKSCQALDAKLQELGKTNCQFHYFDVGHDTSAGYDELQESFRETVLNGTPIENPNPKVTVSEVAE